MRPVHVTMLGERALVEGGQLPREHGWIAELTHTTDKTPFITLNTRSSHLKQMTGSSLTLNAWLANLTTARNAASDNALVALAKTKGMEVSHTTPQHGNAWAKVRGGKKWWPL